jgi:outer membrane protein TolC
MRHVLTFPLLALTLFCSAAQAVETPAASPSPSTVPQASSAPVTAPANPPAATFFLTLTEAIDLALRSHYDVLLAEEKIKDARLQITETSAQGMPQLSLTASYGRQDPIRLGSASDTSGGAGGGGLGSNPQLAAFLGLASVNTFQSRLTLSQLLFAGFRIVDGVRLAQINVGLMEESLRLARQNVAYQVTNAYFNALRSWEVTQLDKESLEQAREQVRMAEARLRAGAGVKLDILQAQSQVIQIQQRLSQDMGTFEKAKMSLNLAMGREADYPVELNRQATVIDLDKEETDSLKNSLDMRSEVRQLAMQKEMSELNATIQGRSIWPTISAQVVYSLQDNQVTGGNTNNVQNMNYSLNMNWPIFDGLAANAKAQRAQQTATQAQINLDQLRQRVIVEVKQAYLDIQESKERMMMAQAGVQVAEENLRVARVSYREGVGIGMDVLNAQLTLLQAKNSLITVRFDLNTRLARLYQSLGLDILDRLR